MARANAQAKRNIARLSLASGHVANVVQGMTDAAPCRFGKVEIRKAPCVECQDRAVGDLILRARHHVRVRRTRLRLHGVAPRRHATL